VKLGEELRYSGGILKTEKTCDNSEVISGEYSKQNEILFEII